MSVPIDLPRAASVDPAKKKLPVWQRVVGGTIAIAAFLGLLIAVMGGITAAVTRRIGRKAD